MSQNVQGSPSLPIKDVYNPVIATSDDRLCTFREGNALREESTRPPGGECTEMYVGANIPHIEAISDVVYQD